MKNTIAIRREDLSKMGEKRVAIVPTLAHKILSRGNPVLLQPRIHPQTKEIKRIFQDNSYTIFGVKLSEDISAADVIFGLKEIESDHILPKKAYYFFSHTHKGQIKNREMLRSLVEQKNTLIDYELITDSNQQRLITAFTYFAGYAGMIDSLWALGKRLSIQGVENAFSNIPQSIVCEDLAKIKEIIKEVAKEIEQKGTPEELPPIICCFLGAGKTSTAAQEIFDLLPSKEITIADLPKVFAEGSRKQLYKLVLDIPDMYRLKSTSPYIDQKLAYSELFQLYIKEPEHFESDLDKVFPYCSLMMNCIIWSPKYPRLLSREDTARWYEMHQSLQLIGDITCDPEGAIHFSKETWIDEPVFIYDPAKQSQQMGFEGSGIAVMAVTNLPCEFSADASNLFSSNLSPLIVGITEADYQAETPQLAGLPTEIQAATILWKGEFTEKYDYMKQYLQ